MGTFLIRDSSRPRCLVISLQQSRKVLHLLLLRLDVGYSVDPEAWKSHPISTQVFPSLDLLVSRLRQLHMLGEGLTVEGGRYACCIHLFFFSLFSLYLSFSLYLFLFAFCQSVSVCLVSSASCNNTCVHSFALCAAICGVLICVRGCVVVCVCRCAPLGEKHSKWHSEPSRISALRR